MKIDESLFKEAIAPITIFGSAMSTVIENSKQILAILLDTEKIPAPVLIKPGQKLHLMNSFSKLKVKNGSIKKTKPIKLFLLNDILLMADIHKIREEAIDWPHILDPTQFGKQGKPCLSYKTIVIRDFLKSNPEIPEGSSHPLTIDFKVKKNSKTYYFDAESDEIKREWQQRIT